MGGREEGRRQEEELLCPSVPASSSPLLPSSHQAVRVAQEDCLAIGGDLLEIEPAPQHLGRIECVVSVERQAGPRRTLDLWLDLADEGGSRLDQQAADIAEAQAIGGLRGELDAG